MNRTSLPKLHAVLLVMLAVAGFAAMTVGSGSLTDPARREIYLALRGTRLVAALLAGAGLAVSGVLVQGLFRNPLASPYVLGTSGGAILGGQLALLGLTTVRSGRELTFVSSDMVLPLGCVLGALLSLLLLLVLIRGRSSLLVVILTGFILSSLFLGLSGFVTAVAQETWELGRAVVAFSLGTVSGASRDAVLFATPMMVVGCVAAYGWGPTLDVLLSGEEEATTLGVDVRAARLWTAVWVSVLVGASVSLGGSIGFVGLVVPHALRPFTGVEHRRLLPAAAVLGGVFVVLCDVVARLVPARSEVPLGVITGLIGAPLFLFLLLRSYRESPHGA